jgi:F1F0 ATPase subunit 2
LVGLEVDAKRMSVWTFDGMPAWAMLLGFVAHLAVGVGLGIVYFRGLWWNARLFAVAGQVPAGVALMIGRIALLGGLLVLASLEGALPLLMMVLGVLVARAIVMRRIREVAP